MKHYYINSMVVFFLIVLLVGFTAVRAADITTTAQGGLWDDKTTWVGGVLPTATDNVFITSTVTTGNAYYSSTTFIMKNLTVNAGGKIIREKEKAGMYSLEISGNLINNGEIIDYKDYFDIKINGNIINNGILKPRIIYLQGQGQKISGTKEIECKTLNLNMTDGELTAASNLSFRNCYITSNTSSETKKLNMKTFSLNLAADEIKYDNYYGQISTACECRQPIIFEGAGKLTIDKAKFGNNTIVGNVTINSPTYAFIADLIVEGDLTIAENSKISSYANLQKLRVFGNFTNYGVLNKDTVKVGLIKFPPRSMNLFIYGNSTNMGSTGISTVLPITNGKTISLSGNYDGAVYIKQSEGSTKPGGKVLINSRVDILGKLDVYANLEIGSAGILNLLYKIYIPITVSATDGSLTNKGQLYQYHKVNSSWGYRSFSKLPGMNIDFELRDWTLPIEGVDVTVYNGSTYPNLPGSTLRWWRVKPVVTGLVKYYTLKLYYDEAQLNGQKEKNLKAFRSIDKGQTWELLSIGDYAKLDTIENSITIGAWNIATSMLKEFGDFVISSGDGSVPLPSPIVIKLVGRDQVRIGAPNRYTVHMQNIDPNKASSSFLVSVNLDGDARFLKVEIPGNNGLQVLPIDSIGNKDDNTLAFYVPGLEPNEESSFDVIITALPDQLKSAAFAPVVIWVAGVAVIGAVSVVADYVTDIVNDQLEMTQKEKEDLSDVTGITLKTMNEHKKKEGIGVYAVKTVLKASIEKLSKLHPVTNLAFTVGEKLEMMAKFSTNLRYRFIAWGKSLFNQDGKNELRMLEDNRIVLEKIVSSDPNEKVGPSGFGKENYISKTGKMYYTISFENKKEATAPAYRIQISDTLSSVFDHNSVKFGATSHSGSMYNWKMTREGNILKWDIEGIELPPNVNPPEGEGYVRFSVDLIQGLNSGQNIDNSATIVFDLNKPITTNRWRNILDEIAPLTKMNPIKYSAGDSIVNISCQTVDNANGSGPGRYGFYASVNNAPFQLIGESYQNTIQYPVSHKTKNAYRFYALATDNVNNVEIKVPQIVELKSFPVSSKNIENNSSKIKLYPNPTSGKIAIDFFIANQTGIEFQISSVSGELIKNVKFGVLEAGKHHLNLDISDLKQGIYLAKVILDQKSEIFKVVKISK